MTETPKPSLRFLDLEDATLEAVLDPPFTLLEPERVHRQLGALDRHVRSLGCRSIAIEGHYVDRDFIDDHSAFYSKNLIAPPNWCQRVHFFSESSLAVVTELDERLGPQRSDLAAPGFYLGYSIIKPLRGCPVGRTVVGPPRATAGATFLFNALSESTVNLRGVRLSVRGLAFQQQDLGVSACATTALWTALQRAADFEPIAAPTPAQITSLASRYLLPFGRSMPSEGLSIAQMCQAAQALGFAPNLIRMEDAVSARNYLHSIHSSGIAPVLILERSPEHHAVTMVGIQTTTKGATVSRPASLKGIYEASDSLVSLFVHDDRQGPYRSAAFVDNGGEPRVVLQLDGENEDWKLTHILVPAHPKIRLGFPSLRDVSLLTAKAVQQVINDESAAPLLVSCRIVKAVQYVDELVAEAHVDRATITTLTTRIALSRYVACIQVSSRDLDALDVLIDTTTTLRTAQALAVVAARRARPLTEAVADGLADNYLQCPVLV